MEEIKRKRGRPKKNPDTEPTNQEQNLKQELNPNQEQEQEQKPEVTGMSKEEILKIIADEGNKLVERLTKITAEYYYDFAIIDAIKDLATKIVQIKLKLIAGPEKNEN